MSRITVSWFLRLIVDVIIDYVFPLISYILPAICSLIAVGWYTLVERKVLGYIITRKGPNKVGYMGLIQPVSDGVKLFTKEVVVPIYSAKWPFILCPIVRFFIALLGWFLYPFSSVEILFACGVVYFMVVAGIRIYRIVVAGWASNSKYALLGAVRGVAQSVSYEVVIALILLSVVYCVGVLDVHGVKMWQGRFGIWGWVWLAELVPFLGVWVIIILAERNRAPFDFVEGESELVSGYNVEYSGVRFGLLYITEYASIILNRLLSACLFIGSNDIVISLIGLSFIFMYIWVRGTYPRYRYDLFMIFIWKCCLPVVLVVLLFELQVLYIMV